MLIEHFPPIIAENLDVIALLILGFLVEKRFVSRPAIWANVAAINVHLYGYHSVDQWLAWYADFGLVVAVLAVFTYASGDSLPNWFYTLAWAYSSIPVAVLVYLTWTGAL